MATSAANRVVDIATRGSTWACTVDTLPTDWVEAISLADGKLEAAQERRIPYVSRRRALPETADVLLWEPFPDPTPGVQAGAKQLGAVPWPEGAPPRPVTLTQLCKEAFLREYDELLGDAALAVAVLESAGTPRIPPERTWEPDEWAAQPFVLTCAWDTSNPADCTPLQPYTPDDPAPHAVRAAFFREWAPVIGSEDDELLQWAETGVASHAATTQQATFRFHHKGLQRNIGAVAKTVDEDERMGRISKGVPHPRYLPPRTLPKNVVRQLKWKVVADGVVEEVEKWRITSDHSFAIGEVPSRNQTMPRDDWAWPGLPSVLTHARAIAILKAWSSELGYAPPAEVVVQWAIDLVDAYRILSNQRSEAHLQCFCWRDGVRVDERCDFGAAHMVMAFERFAGFVGRVTRHRISAFDRRHPYGPERSWWQAERSARGAGPHAHYEQFYIDDQTGGSIHERGRPALLELRTEGLRGRVGVRVQTRPRFHMDIATATANEAGWDVASSKNQIGPRIEPLGARIDSQGAGRIDIPEAKRVGLLRECAAVISDTPLAVPRGGPERLTGRLGHVAQWCAEGRQFLEPQFRMTGAVRTFTDRKGGKRRYAPNTLAVAGPGPTQTRYQEAIRWWRAALEQGVGVPLAPKLTFPALGSEGVALGFTDAAREANTGFGGWAVVQLADGSGCLSPPLMLHLAYPWPDDIRALLVSNALSMPAGEMFGLAFFIITLYHCLPRLQAIIQTTDCSAASSAVNTGSSGSPQINLLVQWLFAALPPPASLQISGLWLPGLQNRMADELSRGDGVAAVLRAQRAGWRTLNVTPPVEAIALSLGFLREVSAESQRR